MLLRSFALTLALVPGKIEESRPLLCFVRLQSFVTLRSVFLDLHHHVSRCLLHSQSNMRRASPENSIVKGRVA